MPEPAAVVDLSEPRAPHVPEGVPPAPDLPPTWPDLEAALVDVDDEDKSHAVEAWRELVVKNGRQLPDWSGVDEDGVRGFVDDYHEKIKQELKFEPAGRPYRHLANEIVLDPLRPADGLNQAWRAGLIEQPTEQDYRRALDVQSVAKENQALREAAGSNQEGKALAVGAGRGAAFMAGAIPSASAFAPAGPATYGTVPLLAGIGGGIITSMGYDELMGKLAENNETIKSFTASSQLQPTWTAAGELLSFAVPAPLGVARGIRRFQLVAENLGSQAAVKQAVKSVAVSGGVGAASAPVMAAIDRFKNEALGLGHDPEQSLFDPKSIAANTVLAIMLGNLGVKFTKFSQGEAAAIHQRGMAGEKLTPAETEVFNTINRKLARTPNSFVFEVEQATMGGRPLEGATAARTQQNPNQTNTPASGASSSAGSPPPNGGGTQQTQGAASGANASPPPRARRFATQDEFNDFMDAANARGDAEAGHEAWKLNNAAGHSNWFQTWFVRAGKAKDINAQNFANSVVTQRNNAAHAEFVRQQKGASDRNGRADVNSSQQTQPTGGGASSPPAGNSPGTPSRSRGGGAESVSPSGASSPLVRRDEGLGQNTAGRLGISGEPTSEPASYAALNGPAAASLGTGATLAPLTAAALGSTPAAKASELDEIERELSAAPLEPTSAPAPDANFSSKKKAGVAAISEILDITGEKPRAGKSVYVIADATGAPIEVFTSHVEAYQHLHSMAGQDEWLWSMPADFNGEAVIEGGLPPRNSPKNRQTPLNDPFGKKFKGTVPAKGSRVPAPVDAPTESTFTGQRIVEVPLANLRLSDDVPQFKGGADEHGITEPLSGSFDRTGVGPIQVWERLNGDLEIISGRHRFDLAQRSGEETIPAQIHREADGFTIAQAAQLDAQLNIRDGQGSVSDYANYFRNSKITKAEADAGGLLGRAKGQAGFSIGTGASNDVFALFQAGKLTDAQAREIAEAAPGNDAAQAIGTRAALDGKSAEFVGNLIKAAQARAASRPAETTGDLFSFDDSAIAEMEAQARVASTVQKGIREQISAVQGAAKRPALAAKLGVDVKDPAGIKARIAELKDEFERWKNWPMHADLVAITRDYEVTGSSRGESTPPPALPTLRPGEKGTGDLLQGEDAPFNLMGEKGVDTVKASEEKASAEEASAEAKAQQDRDQGDLFGAAEGMRRKIDADESGGISASIFQDVVDFGARVLRKGMNFATWAAEMIRHLGEKVAALLHRIWAELSHSEFGSRDLRGAVVDARNESGALFGRGRRERGRQPDALPQEERWLTTRAFWEGSADVFLKHPTFKPLGKAINRQVDLADKRIGDTTGKLEAWESRTNRGDREDAKAVLSQYIDARESGRTADASNILAGANPAARDLIKTIGDIAEYTGRVSTTLVQPNGRVGVEVMDGKTPRPLRNLGKEFWPRILNGEYEAALRDPLSDPALWQQMRNDLVANGNVATVAEADEFLKGGSGNDAANEFLGSLYRARSGRLPPHWHDTSFEGFANWATRWADIVSKIEAFGQKIRPDDKDAFDNALALTTHRPTQSFIHSVRARAYNERNIGSAAKYLLDAPRLLASGLFLTNPVTIGINALSSKVMNTFTYGLSANFARNPLAMFAGKNHLDAYALGVLKRDMVRLLYRDDVPGLDGLKTFVNGAMTISGYRSVENLTRVDSYITALAFLHEGLAAVRKNPKSNSAVQFMAFLKRNKYDVGSIIRENGTGDATDTFLRGTIRDTQGGYQYNQVPWFTDTPLGRFFLQFSKFSTMFTRNVMTNVIRPAFAMDTVTFKVGGKTVTKRAWDVRPLLYFLTGAALGGEAINILKDLAFGIERKDATLSEIAAAMDENTRDGLVLIGIRVLNDILTMGMLGIFGTPIQTARDVTERSRFRNPLAPPGVSLTTNLGNLMQTGLEQKQLTGRDVQDFIKSSVSMYRYGDAFIKQQALNAGIKWKAAELKGLQDDVTFLRTVSNRYAAAVDMPTQRITSQGRRAKDELSPMRADLMEALLLGDQDAARMIVADYLAGFPSIAEKKDKLRSLATVVTNNQPARVGGIAGNARRVEFMQWAKGRLSVKDLARIRAVDEGYRATANAVGLMKANTARDDARLLRTIERDEGHQAGAATPEEAGKFMDRALRPQRKNVRFGGLR